MVTGTATGISSGVSGGGRVSAGSRGATRSFGVSLSAEARSGFMSTSALSAKDRGMINKSSFLNKSSHSSMFDVSRPIRNSGVVRERISSIPRVSRANESRKSSIFNSNQGREIKSKFARTQSLEPKRGMFDLSRPITPRSEHGNRTVAQRTREAGLNPRNRSERVKTRNPYREKLIFWQNAARKKVLGAPRILEVTRVKRQEFLAQSAVRPREMQPIKIMPRRVDNPRIPARSFVKTEAKLKTDVRTHVRRKTLSEMVQVAPSAPPELAAAVRLNIAEAQTRMIPKLMLARNISYREALTQTSRVIQEMYKTEPLVYVIPEVQARVDVQTQAVVLPQTEVKPQIQVGEEKIQKVQLGSENKSKNRKFTYEKDEKATKARITRAVYALESLLKYWNKKDALPTGKDIVYQMGSMGVDAKSEVKTGLSGDGSWDKMLSEISKEGPVENVSWFRTRITKITDSVKALKLALNKKPGLEATEADAQVVYKAPIDKMDAYFAENNNALGKFVKTKDTTWFVPIGVAASAPVV